MTRWSALLLLLLGCASPLEPVADLYRLDPPPHFQAAWEEVAATCRVQPKIAFSGVEWWVVIAPYWTRDGALLRGEFFPTRVIWLSKDAITPNETRTLRHEILHAMIQRIDHPQLFRCLEVSMTEAIHGRV